MRHETIDVLLKCIHGRVLIHQLPGKMPSEESARAVAGCEGSTGRSDWTMRSTQASCIPLTGPSDLYEFHMPTRFC